MTAEAISKTDFAKLSGVTPTRVSQWIREGKITGDGLVGEGRTARIRVAVAQAQLRERRDPSQSLGNGIGTLLNGPPAPDAHTPAARVVDPIGEGIRAAKLLELQFRNERAAEERQERRGIYTRSDLAAAAMSKLAAGMVNTFEGSLTDIGAAIAAKFQIPQRDVIHVLRTEFRTARQKAADIARRELVALPELLQDEVADATDPAAGEA